uniref:Transmembrane 9 superfamily member n=1 Tax=Ananas comosus var. bracteatus TaxID=296719 RepID=A0A6V7PM33_ANACO|nr:unnamed protein product [Ananas comosus var. bracteatus]
MNINRLNPCSFKTNVFFQITPSNNNNSSSLHLRLLLLLPPHLLPRLLPPGHLPPHLPPRRPARRQGQLHDLPRHRAPLLLLLPPLPLPPPRRPPPLRRVPRRAPPRRPHPVLPLPLPHAPQLLRTFLCSSPPLSPRDFALLRRRVDAAYSANLVLDNLPAINVASEQRGFPIGARRGDDYFIFNHLKFTVRVHGDADDGDRMTTTLIPGTGDVAVEQLIPRNATDEEEEEEEEFMVVGFEVAPCSVRHDRKLAERLDMYDEYPAPIECDARSPGMRVAAGERVAFTYDVEFVGSAVRWPSRWDAYLRSEGGAERVHWLSILGSLAVVAMLAAVAVAIMLRTVRRDLARYEALDAAAEAKDDELSGWKLVAGTPSARRAARSCSACSSARGCKFSAWRRPPSFSRPSGSCRPPRAAPSSPECCSSSSSSDRGRVPPWLLVLAAGALPFATLFVELLFIFSSLWMGRVYYVFGFLLLVLGLFVVVCAEVALVLTYVHLCAEDWRWWWKAFFAPGSVAVYVLVYAVKYLVFDLKSLSGPVSAALYLGYSLLMVLAVMLAAGTVGFVSSFWFVHYLFSSVKID